MMLRLIYTTLFCFLFLLLQSVAAQTPPTPDEAFRVLNFYYNGKGNGVVLTESKICRDVYKSGPLKYSCQNEVIEFGPLKNDGTPPEIFHKINQGETVYIWMSLLVPVGAEEQIYLRFNYNGVTMRTSGNLTVKGSTRYRTWTNFTPAEQGDWEIEIFRENNVNPELLETYTLTVE